MINTHTNDAKSGIGIIPNKLLATPAFSGKALANIPARTSETAVAAKNVPTIKDRYLTGANFETKLKPIGAMNNSEITKVKLNKTIQSIFIFPGERYTPNKRIKYEMVMVINPKDIFPIDEGSLFLTASQERNLMNNGLIIITNNGFRLMNI